MNRTAQSKDVQDYRLSELERDYDTLLKQVHRSAWKQEEIKQELRETKQETKRHFDELSELLHSRFFWLMFALLAGLCILGVLVTDFRLDLAHLLDAL